VLNMFCLFSSKIVSNYQYSALSQIVKKTYPFFGSGAMHGPYALFQKYLKENNNGKNIGMFCSTGTRMGGEVIALMRMYRLKDSFL
jgi:hypothetical protein